MPSFIITEVEYAKDRRRIHFVKAHKRMNGYEMKAILQSRANVIVNILERGFPYSTGFVKGNRIYEGARVMVHNVRGEHYLKTEKNETKEDNLGELLEF
jgi:hypothetical protein